MKADKDECFEFYSNGKLVQVTFKVSLEKMHIKAIKYFRDNDMEIPEQLISRAELALNRLILHEARNEKY